MLASIELHAPGGFVHVATFKEIEIKFEFEFDRWLDSVIMQLAFGSGS